MKTFLRLAAVSALVLVGLLWPTASQADPGPSATIAATVTCDGGQGSVDITLTAGSADVSFGLWGSHEGFQSGDEVEAGQSKDSVFFLPNKSDTVSVGVFDPESDDIDLSGAQVVATATLRARCDETPYTNAGYSFSDCEGHVDLYFQNQSSAYNPDDVAIPDPVNDPTDVSGPDMLQPVTYTVTGEAADGTQTVLDTFVLDKATPTHQDELGPDELGDAVRVILTTQGGPDDATPDVLEVNHDGCVNGGTANPVEPTSASLPDTGY